MSTPPKPTFSPDLCRPLAQRPSISPDLCWPHVSTAEGRGYVENDPIVRVSTGEKLRGDHGLMDVRAEIARTAYDASQLNNPIIRDLLKK